MVLEEFLFERKFRAVYCLVSVMNEVDPLGVVCQMACG